MARDPSRPRASVTINGFNLPVDILEFIQSIEVDQSRDMADQIKLRIANPVKAPLGALASGLLFVDNKAFMPGNQIDISLGYGDDLKHVCSGIIQKWLPHFPNEGVPSLEVVALDASVRLMDGETGLEARNYPNFDYDLVVLEVLNRHQILPGQVDAIAGTARENLFKKRGMTDYQLVKGLANLVGHEFKVYYDATAGQWKAHWRQPRSDQSKIYTFTYGGDLATLLSFDPEWGLRDMPNEVKVMYWDAKSHTYEEITVGKRESGEDLKLTDAEFKKFFDSKNVIQQEIKSMSKLRVAAGDVAVDIIPERPFETADAAQKFAEKWLRDRINSFIMGSGKIIGLESLRPGDVHRLAGIGNQLSGDWEFTSVRHKFDTNDGYICEFSSNKVVTE